MLNRFSPWVGAFFASATAAGGFATLQQQGVLWKGLGDGDDVEISERVPTRVQQLSRLRDSTASRPFDVLIIGGGATGAGSAVDAATRGLRTALVERSDFASGTSSKSSKLVHGGVRYLEKAVWQADLGQLKLVYEALHERREFLDNAPHLAAPLPILTPCYHWWEVPYYWAGLKCYDLVAGFRGLIGSRFVGREEASGMMPTLALARPDGATLKGAVLYYDGQFDDARVNVALACTAAAAGAVVANYAEVTRLIKNPDGKVTGAVVRDVVGGDEVEVHARVVVNATGPLADLTRRLSEPDAASTVTGASGAHVTLPAWYGGSGQTVGMIVPKTKDGRVLFFLPFLGHMIAGTTDSRCDVGCRPRATEEEVHFILATLSDHLGIHVRRSDVLSAWSGVRPLPSNPKKAATEGIVRDHVIYTDEDGMITVTGGKWTTYRRMAEEVVDAAVATGRLPLSTGHCATHKLRLLGARRFHRALHTDLAQTDLHPSFLDPCTLR